MTFQGFIRLARIPLMIAATAALGYAWDRWISTASGGERAARIALGFPAMLGVAGLLARVTRPAPVRRVADAKTAAKGQSATSDAVVGEGLSLDYVDLAEPQPKWAILAGGGRHGGARIQSDEAAIGESPKDTPAVRGMQ